MHLSAEHSPHHRIYNYIVPLHPISQICTPHHNYSSSHSIESNCVLWRITHYTLIQCSSHVQESWPTEIWPQTSLHRCTWKVLYGKRLFKIVLYVQSSAFCKIVCFNMQNICAPLCNVGRLKFGPRHHIRPMGLIKHRFSNSLLAKLGAGPTLLGLSCILKLSKFWFPMSKKPKYSV